MKNIMKKIYVHPLMSAVIFFSVYSWSFKVMERLTETSRAVLVHHPLDDIIPFCRFMVIPYLTWQVEFAVLFLFLYFRKDLNEFWRSLITVALSVLAAMVVYVRIPTVIYLRPAVVEGNDICAILTRMIYAYDDNRAVCPSTHVLSTVVMQFAWMRTLSDKRLRFSVTTVNILIILSTMLLKQHSVIDVELGLLFGIAIELMVTSARRFMQPALHNMIYLR